MVEPPFAVLDRQRRERRRAAGEPHAVHEAGVDRVGEDDLVAGIDRREQHVEHALAAAARDHDLALGVVGRAVALRDVVGDRRAQVEIAGERQPRVADRVVERLARDLPRLGRKRQVGVQVLEPEHVGIGDRRGHPVDAEAGHAVHPPARASSRPPESGSEGCPRRVRAPRRCAGPSPSTARSRRAPSSIGCVRRPDAHPAVVDVQQLLDPERMRRRLARFAGMEPDRVQLAEQPGPVDPLEQVRVERRALDVRAFAVRGRPSGPRCGASSSARAGRRARPRARRACRRSGCPRRARAPRSCCGPRRSGSRARGR